MLLLALLAVMLSIFGYKYLNRKKEPKVLVIKGIIGPGKSTLVEILEKNTKIREKYPKIVVIKEPVELWQKSGAFTEFYKDKKKYAYEFQSFVFATRILAVQKAYEENSDADLYVLERDCDCDEFAFFQTLYEDKFVEETQIMKYKVWSGAWRKLWPFKRSHVLFIDPGIEACMERLKKRDREGEIVPIEYQQHLYNNYVKMIDNCKDKTLKLTLKTDYREKGKEQGEVINIILNFLN